MPRSEQVNEANVNFQENLLNVAADLLRSDRIPLAEKYSHPTIQKALQVLNSKDLSTQEMITDWIKTNKKAYEDLERIQEGTPLKHQEHTHGKNLITEHLQSKTKLENEKMVQQHLQVLNDAREAIHNPSILTKKMINDAVSLCKEYLYGNIGKGEHIEKWMEKHRSTRKELDKQVHISILNDAKEALHNPNVVDAQKKIDAANGLLVMYKEGQLKGSNKVIKEWIANNSRDVSGIEIYSSVTIKNRM